MRSKQLNAALLKCCLLIFLVWMGGASCKKGFDDYYGSVDRKGGYLYEKLKSNENFTEFAKALETAGLVDFLSKGGLYTVFAPTNTAVKAFLTERGYTSIDQMPVAALFEMLSYHVVNNMWYQYDLQQRFKNFKQTLFLTRSMKFLEIAVTDTSITAGGVPVIKELKNLDAENGVIHGIGKVLVPYSNLELLLKTDASLANSSFYKLMQVMADSSYDRFNSFDRDRNGVIDSIFFKTYPLLGTVYTSLEFRANTIETNQGGDPVFTTVIIPDNKVLDPYLAPVLQKNGNDIRKVSRVFAAMLLQPYFIYDTAKRVTSNMLVTRPQKYYSVNNLEIPPLGADNFLRKDLMASNGIVHVIDSMFKIPERLTSAVGIASREGDLTMFMDAIQDAGLVGELTTVANLRTCFAPTNQAFINANFDVKKKTLNGVNLTTTQFTNIVRNHIIGQNLPAASLPGSKATLYGTLFPLEFSANGTTVTSSNGEVANVTLPAVAVEAQGRNYVYKVDKILVPRLLQ